MRRRLSGHRTNRRGARRGSRAARDAGGALLLKAAVERLGLSAALAAVMRDPRDPRRMEHTLTDLLRQRVFLLVAGYEDCNDAAHLIDDPIPRTLLGRDPVNGAAIASKPTLSRFENAVDRRSLVRLGHALADTVIARHQKRLRRRQVRRITIDLDPTDDRTHGQQQLSLFNAHYGGWCFLPVVGFLQFDDESEQYLFRQRAPGRSCRGERGGLRDPRARDREAREGLSP